MAGRKESGRKRTRNEREHGRAVPQTLSGFSCVPSRKNDLRFAGRAGGVDIATGQRYVPDLRRRHAKGSRMMRIEGSTKSESGVNSPLFSVSEAAVYLGMSKDWVYGHLKTLIPHVKIGGALKFRKEDMDRYIASQTIAPMNVRDVKSPANLRELMREPRIQN